VLRDGIVVHSVGGGPERPSEARFHWDDSQPAKSDNPMYFYVRAVQKDGQMAWSAPIWVRGNK
jgi:hypothetical protein